mmetsp:Transcript_40123/g.114690  ORF Transcript_40123/g.114690 Transcript_40123/m.114690 type:complete len:762 (-) Transcript_40123:348-2633(-)
MVAIAAISEPPRSIGDTPRTVSEAIRTVSKDSGDVCIHPWEQFVHSFRTKVTSLHHNVSAVLTARISCGVSWRPTGEPVWLLGRRYQARRERGLRAPGPPAPGLPRIPVASVSAGASGSGGCGEGTDGGNSDDDSANSAHGEVGSPEDFAAAWAQITRMTYRKGFAPMYRCVRTPAAGSDERGRHIRLTSDAGWGCMIRVGQMLLATVLKRHLGIGAPGAFPEGDCGVDDALTAGSGVEAACALERQFLDDPCPARSPFSIFSFIRVAHGGEVAVPPVDAVPRHTRSRGGPAQPRQLTQKLPGDWFGPTTISETIAALVEQDSDLCTSLAVYVDADGVLYEDEVRALASGRAPSPAPPANKLRASRAGCRGDSDDEFMVVSTASVSSASAFSPLLSTSRGLSPQLVPETGGEMEASSFHELQPGFELCALELPPAAVTDGRQLPDTPVRACEAALAARPVAAGAGQAPRGAEAAPRWDRGVLLLFPLQLGPHKYVSEARVPAVLRYLELQSSLGAMGGRPRMAHYLVGRQGRSLLYVDPHVVQPAAISGSEGEASEGAPGFAGTETFKNGPTVQIIPVEQIDSSISFAFYCRCEADLKELVEGLQRVEADEGPIRSETTRPLALRLPQALWHDTDCLWSSFTEVSQREDPAACGSAGASEAGAESEGPEEESATADGGLAEDTAIPPGEHLDATEAACEADGGTADGSVQLGPRGRMLCVGTPWADGPWAEVEEGNVIEVYRQSNIGGTRPTARSSTGVRT